ncbi:MAG: hypothetical protein ACJ71C_09245, partial [Nitrososphaeraceae archaeon]
RKKKMQAAYQHQQQIILQLIKDCNNEHNLHKRIEILYSINSILPTEHTTKNTIADYKCVYQYSLIQNRRNILIATSECYRNNTYTCLGPFSDFLKSCMMRVYFISLNTSFFFYFSGS